MASDVAGNFVVVWQSTESAGSDTDGSASRANASTAAGRRRVAQFQVNSTPRTRRASRPYRWTSRGTSSSCGRVSVAGRTATRASRPGATTQQGRRWAAQFQVNGYTTSLQYGAAVASEGGGTHRGLVERRQRRRRRRRPQYPGAALRRDGRARRRAISGERVHHQPSGDPDGDARRRGRLCRRVGERWERRDGRAPDQHPGAAVRRPRRPRSPPAPLPRHSPPRTCSPVASRSSGAARCPRSSPVPRRATRSLCRRPIPNSSEVRSASSTPAAPPVTTRTACLQAARRHSAGERSAIRRVRRGTGTGVRVTLRIHATSSSLRLRSSKHCAEVRQ